MTAAAVLKGRKEVRKEVRLIDVALTADSGLSVMYTVWACWHQPYVARQSKKLAYSPVYA